MIQINLVPDVKQELLKAQRQRTFVVSLAILVSAIAVAIVILMGIYLLVQQAVVNNALDNSIDELSAEIEAKDGLPSALTIQKQLGSVPELYDSRNESSRLFDLLSAITPDSSDVNSINVSKLNLQTDMNLITIEAQAENGYEALESFKKTIEATDLVYVQNGEEIEEPLTAEVSDGDRSFGEDSSSTKVLRFTVSFVYPENLFSTTTSDVRIVGPDREINVTDSKINVPSSLFSDRIENKEDE